MALHKGQTGNVIELRTGGKKTSSVRGEVLRRRTGKLCRRFAEEVVVEAGGRAERQGSSSPKKSWSTIRWFTRDCASIRPATGSMTGNRGLRCKLLAIAKDGTGNASSTLQMNQPVDLDREHHRHPGRLHSRLLRSRQPGIQDVRRHREPGFRSGSQERATG